MNWSNILVPLDIGKLSKKEKTIFVLIYGIIPITLISSLLIFQGYIYNDMLSAVIILIPFDLLFLGIASQVIFHNNIVKKVKYLSEYRLWNTYQYGVFGASFFLPSVISGGLAVGYMFNNLVLGVGLSLAFAVPMAGEFLRRDVFNDNSCNLNGKIVMGYEPGRFMLLSVFIGLYGYINVFRNIDSYGHLIWILIIFSFQLLLIFPDKINKVFPLEIRTKYGHFAYLGFVLVLFLIFILMCQRILIGTGVRFLHFNLKSIICWIAGAILAIVFVKKYKDMWN